MTLAELRLLTDRIHRLGERVFFEMVRELLAGADAVETLERYAALDAFAPPRRSRPSRKKQQPAHNVRAGGSVVVFRKRKGAP